MLSTMQPTQLNISTILDFGATVHKDAKVTTWTDQGPRVVSFGEIGQRAAQLAHALRGLGIDGDQRVATFQWNNSEHMEAYLAVPSMGAIAHPVNVRLDIDYLVESIRLAGDTVLVVDPHWSEILLEIVERIEVVRHVVFLGASVPDLDLPEHVGVHTYEGLLDGRPTWFPWPEVDENDAAVIAFTSGTTGEPKGVAFSHRSIWLHSMEMCMAECAGLWAGDTVLVTVPLFHASDDKGVGLVLPGMLCQVPEASGAWVGLCLSVEITASGTGASKVNQQLKLERHHSWPQ